MDKPDIPKTEGKASKKTRKNLLITIVVIVAVALLLFVVQPAILGFGVGVPDVDNSKVEALGNSIEELRLELESKSTLVNEDLQQKLDLKSEELAACVIVKSSLEGTSDLYEKNIDSLELLLAEKDASSQTVKDENAEEVNVLKDEILALKASYDLLIENMAHSICCKQKVDNPNINYYSIINNKTACLEDGEHQLTCFS